MEVEKKSVNGLGIASLAFGIVGILTMCGCGIGFFFGLIGIILGILGLTVLKNSGKGFPIAGLIVSGIALVFGSVWMFLYIPRHNSKDTDSIASTSTTSSSSSSSGTSSSNNKPSSDSGSSYSSKDYDSDASWDDVKDAWNDLKNDIKGDTSSSESSSDSDSSSSSSSSSSNSSSSGSYSSSKTVTPELKEYCDSYEALMDQYINLLESADQDTPEFMTQYAEYMMKLADFEEKSAYWDEKTDEMSDADYAYYSACMTRISANLIKYSITTSY